MAIYSIEARSLLIKEKGLLSKSSHNFLVLLRDGKSIAELHAMAREIGRAHV